jgi:hypothetical protein
MWRLIAAMALVTLGGCETAQGVSDAALPRYQGKSVDLVLQRWGMPTRLIKGDGGIVLMWENAVPARDCRVELHVDERRHVLGWRYVGPEGACRVWMKML